MVVEKQVISTEKVEVPIYGIKLLSIEEYQENRDMICILDGWWWLSSTGYGQSDAAYVYYDSSSCDYYFTSGIGYVRPALIGNFKSSNLKRGDKIEVAGYTWTVLDNELALCDKGVGRTCFRKDWEANNANDYDASDIKKWLHDWAEENGISFTMQTFSPD